MSQFFYVRRAHKAEKLDLDLGQARDKALIAYNVVAVTILDKGTGTFTLTWHFYDGTEFSLNQDEVLNGDVFEWDIARLYLTNAAQAGARLKLIVDIQLGPSPAEAAKA
jgi:hypothetical protein